VRRLKRYVELFTGRGRGLRLTGMDNMEPTKKAILWPSDRDVAIEALELMIKKLEKYTHGEMVKEKVKSLERVAEFLKQWKG